MQTKGRLQRWINSSLSREKTHLSQSKLESFTTMAAAIFSLLIFCTSLLISPSSSSPISGLQILQAERQIDLTSHIVRVYMTLKVENIGDDPASKVLLAFPPSQFDHLSFVKAATTVGKKRKKSYVPLEVNPAEQSQPDSPNGTKYYAISLINSLPKGETTTLEIFYVLTHSLDPFPVEISQSESQLVYYRDSAVILSPYNIKQQASVVKTPTSKVESFTQVGPTHQSGSELRYGPYEDREPYSYSPVIVHFENNHPFAVVEELEREIEISHWGSVQVTEHYKLANAGAKHKGFSRLDYQSNPTSSGASSFKHLLAELPAGVHSVYYRDNIGNISSSRLRVNSKKSELFIEPRYPLFGGWKSTFVIGYGVPLQDFLFESDDGARYLNYTFGCPLADTIVDKLTIKVVLPEGSKDPSIKIPFEVEQSLETKHSYLDVIGRPVVVLKKNNVVPEHNVPFQVHYKFNPIFMLAEPLMLTSAFFLFFITCVAYLHIDLSLRK
ncbi:glycosyltransferase subunit [Striga asiatica]|uniref:Dolichyl-diphosphooligosaccharide--protein glycosyltransferase subunit 1 n=1 Tax=Striga asiatica TaxID=4170 RepID=A0A5A7QYB5_STRAF|nr:glycosyltransferase subunit [Striga asiatica]